MNEELLRKIQAHGPWEEHCSDYGDPYNVCHYCGVEALQGTPLENQSHMHQANCLWLEIVKG